MASVIGFITVLLVLFGATYIFYKVRSGQIADSNEYGRVTLDSLLVEFKGEVTDITQDNGSILVSDINYEVIARDRKRIADAIPDAYDGIPAARDIMIGLARNFLEKKFRNKEEVLEVIDLEDTQFMEAYWLWEILLFKLEKRLRNPTRILRYLEENYTLTEMTEKTITEYVKGEKVVVDRFNIREFDTKKLQQIFQQEVASKAIEESILTYEECLDLLAIYMESRFTGVEMLDTFMQLKPDGYNFGSSGSIRYIIDGKYDVPYRTTNSLWVQIDAKWVNFSFLDLKNVNKMRKIVNQLTSYGTAPPATEKRPYKVVDGYDGSRRVMIRPGAGESWFYSQRNFTLSVYKMKELLDKPYVKNWELPATLIRFLMMAEETTAFTGPQNTGKTTLMKSAAEYIEDKNIRVLEMSFELALREIYPYKNIMTVKPTDYVSSSQLQDLLKKTDGWVSMVGEVAEDIVAARMIQFCLVASAFTIFSHHGKGDWGLINGLTNSLVASGEYNDHSIAMSTVLDAVSNNVRLNFTENRERIIEYISQIIKEDELQPYPEVEELLAKAKHALKNEDAVTLADCMVAYTMLNREYYTRTTDRVRFTSRKIIVYDPKLKAYVPNEWYTPDKMQDICNKLPESEKAAFIKFYVDNWINKEYLKKLEGCT